MRVIKTLPCLWAVFLVWPKGRYTRGILLPEHVPGAHAPGQSSSVCTNDFNDKLHPREQNFHPAKCSTIFNRLNIWEKDPGEIERTWKGSLLTVLTGAKWAWSMLREQKPSCVSALNKLCLLFVCLFVSFIKRKLFGFYRPISKTLMTRYPDLWNTCK